MKEISPIRGSNAIDEVAFAVHFKNEFSEDVASQMKGLESELSEALPNFEVLNILKMHLDNSHKPTAPVTRPSGVMLSKKSQNEEASGRLEWMLRVEENRIVAACSEYTSWNEVWGRAREFLLASIGKVNLDANPIVEIVFQCVDRFFYDGSPDEFKLDQAFNLDSDYLTGFVIKNKPPAWHIHQGWYEDSQLENARLLNNLNINAHGKRSEEGRQYEVTISHLVKAQGAVIDKESPLHDKSDGHLDRMMAESHGINREILKSLLTTSLLNKVGLTD